MSLPEYEIFAIKYGERVGKRGAIFVHGDPHDAPLAMDYFVWVIRNPERTVVLDIGFSEEEGKRRGRTCLRCPAESPRLGRRHEPRGAASQIATSTRSNTTP